MAVTGYQGGEGTHGSREVRWLTPTPIVQALGAFDLDPCGAPGHDLARTTYQIDDGQDGLVLPWYGRVWLNPPYGAAATPFLERMAHHGHGTALLFARTETEAFHTYVWPHATAVLFLKRRIRFWRPDGVEGKNGSGAPSVLIAYGHDDADALREAATSGRLPGAVLSVHAH